MFVVRDNNKPAQYPDCHVDAIWDNCRFPKFANALGYAKEWLGEYAETLPDNWDGSKLDYSGSGDTIEIRKE